MTNDERAHRMELRLQKLESRITYGGAAILAIAAVFGLTGIKTITDVKGKLANARDEIMNEELVKTTERLSSEVTGFHKSAAEDAAAIQAERSALCPDPDALAAYGQCIYHWRAPGGHYALNYGAAEAACGAQGARLCEKAEVKAAYETGFSECAYGWVQDLEKTASEDEDPTYDRTGTLILAITEERSGSGCAATWRERAGQNILTQNANAFCCK